MGTMATMAITGAIVNPDALGRRRVPCATQLPARHIGNGNAGAIDRLSYQMESWAVANIKQGGLRQEKTQTALPKALEASMRLHELATAQ
jgi:hypothetical protein